MGRPRCHRALHLYGDWHPDHHFNFLWNSFYAEFIMDKKQSRPLWDKRNNRLQMAPILRYAKNDGNPFRCLFRTCALKNERVTSI